MTFVPTRFDHSVNSPHTPLWKQCLLYGAGFIALCVFLYVLLSWTAARLLSLISIEQEVRLWRAVLPLADIVDGGLSPAQRKQEQALRALFDRLPRANLPAYPYEVRLWEEEDANAMALPGGVIVVTTGLLRSMRSENALVFVLGHELGHFTGRDHLEGLGHGLAMTALVGLISGNGEWLQQKLSYTLEVKWRQRQETAADRAGLAILHARYGHVGGATEFFERILNPDQSRWARALEKYASSHPLTADRIQAVNKLIHLKGYQKKTVRPCGFCAPAAGKPKARKGP